MKINAKLNRVLLLGGVILLFVWITLLILKEIYKDESLSYISILCGIMTSFVLIFGSMKNIKQIRKDGDKKNVVKNAKNLKLTDSLLVHYIFIFILMLFCAYLSKFMNSDKYKLLVLLSWIPYYIFVLSFLLHYARENYKKLHIFLIQMLYFIQAACGFTIMMIIMEVL